MRKKILFSLLAGLFLLLALYLTLLYKKDPEQMKMNYYKVLFVFFKKYSVSYNPKKFENFVNATDIVFSKKGEIAEIDYKGLKVKANLKMLFPEKEKIGMLLEMRILNNTGNKLNLDLTSTKLGYKASTNENLFMPAYISVPQINLPNGKWIKLRLVYYPENNIYTSRKYGYYGDLRDNYFVDLSEAVINGPVRILPVRIYFEADKIEYKNFLTKFGRDKKYIDYKCKLTSYQKELLEKRKILFYQDNIGISIINNQTPLGINVYRYNDSYYVKIKILQGNVVIDENNIKASIDGKTFFNSTNGFKQLSEYFRKYLVNGKVLNINLAYPFEYIFRFDLPLSSTFYLDLRGLVIKNEKHEQNVKNIHVQATDHEVNYLGFLPFALKFEK
ncbi:hypothetical protein [Caldicellulosiruptor danielii]|uniref:DUF4352 domain-containing protein n=2 Tax=Anaerocellum danielii TaxID=1387557 RepID=A0ABZ0U2J8_9FIRM|nr:hypothetical protein [Caldicellulosiruptor danielii]WPX08669.1 hypothetical protein SOJ16_002572 [Caldicellulosiruptor danielii]